MQQSQMEVEKAKLPKDKRKRQKETLGKEKKTRIPKEQDASPIKVTWCEKMEDLKK
jgi:hypothetical protein